MFRAIVYGDGVETVKKGVKEQSLYLALVGNISQHQYEDAQ